jgi:hypothetical protein
MEYLMIIVNCEADEILMHVCTRVTGRSYFIQYSRTGASRKLGANYYVDGRFSRKRVAAIQLRLGKVEGIDYEIVLKKSDDNLPMATCILARLLRKIYHNTIKFTGDNVFLQLWLGPTNGSNFRFKSAQRQPYKAGRSDKPEIYYELRQYIISTYEAKVIEGYEADDALGIHKGIMCHQDKDIAMVAGDHYDFVKNEFYTVNELGHLYMKNNVLKGTGKLFFYAQLLTGDRTDNIPSTPHPKYKGWGSVSAYNLLKDCKSSQEAFKAVLIVYKEAWGNNWSDRLLEQADLVWICQEYGVHGSDYIIRMLSQ